MSHSTKPGSAVSRKAESTLRDHCIALPEVTEDFPWGHRTLKVRKKAFVFMTCDETGLSLSVMLPHSDAAARRLPSASPTGYGLGRSGWVSAQFGPTVQPPVELLKRWL